MQEVEALIALGERAGHPLPACPEVVLGSSSRAWSARSGRPARIAIHDAMLQTAPSERRWLIGHELGHLLLGVNPRPASVLARVLSAGGVVLAVVSLVGLLLVAVVQGFAYLFTGPLSELALMGVVSGALIGALGEARASRERESACDVIAAVVYGQTMGIETAARVLREEGLLRWLPRVLADHPRPEQRRKHVLATLAEGPDAPTLDA